MTDRLKSLLELYEKDSNDPFIKYGIALEYLSKKDYAKAEEFFQLILSSDPDYVPAYMQYGQMQANRNNLDEAREIFRRGIETAKQTGDKHAAKEMEEFLDELD